MGLTNSFKTEQKTENQANAMRRYKDEIVNLTNIVHEALSL